MPTLQELRQKRAGLITESRGILDADEFDEERYDALQAEIDSLAEQIERLERQERLDAEMRQSRGRQTRQAPVVIERTGDGPDESRAIADYVRSGRPNADLADLFDGEGLTLRWSREAEERAAKDEIMNITTDADGKYWVPVTLVQRVIARKAEAMLADRLGVQRIPGKGTTVNHPVEGGDAQVFAATDEQVDDHSKVYERDAPIAGIKAFTLAKKTKKLELTEELLDDEDVGLMSFIGDHIGRGLAATHNSMLLTEVGTNGTPFKTFADDVSIANKELEDIAYHDTLSWYLDDGGSIQWVMRPSTYGTIVKLDGDARVYVPTPQGSNAGGRDLLGYPVQYSNYASAIGVGAKSVYFGNWWYVGMREEPALRILRDPYSVDGLVIIKYSFRGVYGVLQAGAIGYGVQSTVTT